MSGYLIQIKNYRVVKNMYDSSMKEFRRQQSVILEYNPIKPKSPNLMESFTDAIIGKIIRKTLRQRITWRKSMLKNV